MHRVRTVAVMNQKGGVGKTTTVANLSAAIARRGQRVWALDLDPQCHLSLHFDVDATSERTLSEVLVDELAIAEAARAVTERLTVVPGSVDLAGVETELAAVPGRERRLANQLAFHIDADVVLIDCPPSLGLLTLNALAAADEVLIPLQPHFLALQGLGQLLQTVSLVAERINPRLRVTGVLLCMFERITRLANEVVVDLHQFFEAACGQATPWSNAKVLETVIRRNIKLAEAPSHGLSIFDYDPASNGAADYESLAEEFLALAVDTPTDAATETPADPTATPADTPLADAANAAPLALPVPAATDEDEAPAGL